MFFTSILMWTYVVRQLHITIFHLLTPDGSNLLLWCTVLDKRNTSVVYIFWWSWIRTTILSTTLRYQQYILYTSWTIYCDQRNLQPFRTCPSQRHWNPPSSLSYFLQDKTTCDSSLSCLQFQSTTKTDTMHFLQAQVLFLDMEITEWWLRNLTLSFG